MTVLTVSHFACRMILLDAHVRVNWILKGDAALPPAVVDAMQEEDCLAVSTIFCFEVWLLAKRDGKTHCLRAGFLPPKSCIQLRGPGPNPGDVKKCLDIIRSVL